MSHYPPSRETTGILTEVAAPKLSKLANLILLQCV